MKNIITKFKNVRPVYFVVAFVMLAVALAVPMQKQITRLFSDAAESKIYYMGDVDFNGKVEPSDARTVLRAAVRLTTLSGQEGENVYPVESGKPNQAQVADIDGDLKITSADARAILRMSVNLDELKEVDNYGTVEEPNPYDDDLSFAPTAADYSYDPTLCRICGKRQGSIYMSDDPSVSNWPYICWELNGGCCRSMDDYTCPYCGEDVPRMTCHTCKTLKPEYQKIVDSDEFKQKVERYFELLKEENNDDLTTTEEYEYDYDHLITEIPDMEFSIPDFDIDFNSIIP